MIGSLLDPARRRVAAPAAVMAVAAVVAAALWSERAPSPMAATAPAKEFSAERALGPLGELATEPRPLGSAASDRARDRIVGELRVAGFSVEVTSGVGASGADGLAALGRVDNIVATLPGRDPTGSVVLAAHYDSVPSGPGASDDLAAVAAMLETGRALRTGPRLRNDLVLLITDGEEDGLLGAAEFAGRRMPLRQPVVVLNWEARGVSGPSLMFETSQRNAALVRLFADAAPHPHGDSSTVEFYRQLPNDTDFTVFARAGLTGLNFAYLEGSGRYHTRDDSVAHLDPASLQHHGANMLGLTRAFGDKDLATLDADHDATYFRFLTAMIVYPVEYALPLAVLAVLGLVVLARRRRLLSIPRLLLGSVWVALPLVTAGAAAQGMWWALTRLRPDYANNAFPFRPQLYTLAIAALAGVAVLAWYLSLRRRIGPTALVCGPLVWLGLLGVFTAVASPGSAHLFALPALGLGLGGLAALGLPRRSVAPTVAVVAGVVPAAVFLPLLAVGVLDILGMAAAGAAAVLMALLALTLLPLVELLPAPVGKPAVLVPVTGIALVLALVGAGMAVDRIDAAHPRRANLTYLMDTDSRRASWLSADTVPAQWTRDYVTERREFPAIDFGSGPVWTGPAPALALPAPEVTLRARVDDPAADRPGAIIDLHVSSPRAAREVTLLLDHPVTQVTATAPGLAPAAITLDGAKPGRWPAAVRFGDLPPEGVDLRLRMSGGGPLRISAYDRSLGLTAVPGFRPRPPELVRRRSDSDTITVARTYEF